MSFQGAHSFFGLQYSSDLDLDSIQPYSQLFEGTGVVNSQVFIPYKMKED